MVGGALCMLRTARSNCHTLTLSYLEHDGVQTASMPAPTGSGGLHSSKEESLSTGSSTSWNPLRRVLPVTNHWFVGTAHFRRGSGSPPFSNRSRSSQRAAGKVEEFVFELVRAGFGHRQPWRNLGSCQPRRTTHFRERQQPCPQSLCSRSSKRSIKL